jgi:Asp-tRNA(Asn)/Glu-tRNA(Gln) amidotransferase A subunit family amidase
MTVWISRRPDAEVAAELKGSQGPLAGVRLAVKDNVDAAGLPTTAGCPEFAYQPERDAAAVAALQAAGAVVVGKTNLDQLATGLVGTRSPYGAVADSRRPEFISGGSSSGSAVAVAIGEAGIAIGTDTAGSGRVPAGLQGIVGIKPTLGVISTDGVVPGGRRPCRRQLPVGHLHEFLQSFRYVRGGRACRHGGAVEFDDGTWRTAFGCDGAAANGPDITAYGSWPAAIAAGAV